MSSLVLIGSGCLVCLMPLALYFFFLAFLNQRERPTLLSGVWDFACVLLGLSGFLLVGGPVVLSLIDSNWRSYWFGGNLSRIRNLWAASSVIWSWVSVVYFFLLIGGVILFLWLRRSVTVIYNYDAFLIEDAITGTLDHLGIRWRRVVGGIDIGQGRRRPLVDDAEESPASPQDRHRLHLAGETAFLRIDVLASLRHVTLRWSDYTPALRREIESALERTLRETESPPNPAGAWFMTAAVALFFIMLVWMGFLIWWMIAHPKPV